MQTLLVSTLLCSFISITSIKVTNGVIANHNINTSSIAKNTTPPKNADSKYKKNICPICHKADKVIPIRYGKPGSELMKLAEAGKVKLGGCVISAKSPRSYCKRDMHDF